MGDYILVSTINYYIYYAYNWWKRWGLKKNESITNNNAGGNNNNGGCNSWCGYGGKQMNPPLNGGFVIDEYFWVGFTSISVKFAGKKSELTVDTIKRIMFCVDHLTDADCMI